MNSHNVIINNLKYTLLALLFGSALVLVPNAAAEEVMSENVSFLEVNPVVSRITLSANDNVEHPLLIKNSSSSPTSFKAYVRPYSLQSDGNTPDYEAENSYNQIFHWITFKDDEGNYSPEVVYEAAAGETKEIFYKVSVPEKSPGGGQYASILIEAIKESPKDQMIKTRSRTAIKVLAEMSGETKRQMTIENFSCNGYLLNGNIKLDTSLRNSGNIDAQANTEITVKSLFGEELYHNIVADVIMPETEKHFYAEWPDTPLVGIFQVSGKISAVDKSTEIEKLVVILPIWFTIGVIIIIAIVTVLIVYGIKRQHAKIIGMKYYVKK